MVGAGTGEPIRAIGMIRWQDLIASSRLLITAQNANAPPLPNSIRRSVSTGVLRHVPRAGRQKRRVPD